MQSNGEAVVFVSGAFNVLHPGHLQLLRYAKERGGRLVVGVFSQNSSERKDLFADEVRLNSLRHINLVDDVLLTEGDVVDLVKELRPDLVV